MQKTIFVTGVTRMRNGFVCVSGIDEEGHFVRPQIQYPERTGIRTDFLFVNGQVVIKPLVKVSLEFLKQNPKSAFHTEDFEIDGTIPPTLIEIPTEEEKRFILSRHTDQSLERALADQSRSLVIVRSRDVPIIEVRTWEDSLRCHLSFHDDAGDYHQHLRVTDVNWLAICKHLRRNDRNNITQRLAATLRNREIFIRVGITRQWQGQVWRQVSGVFTIPDWLQGYCFADYGYDFTDDV